MRERKRGGGREKREGGDREGGREGEAGKREEERTRWEGETGENHAVSIG